MPVSALQQHTTSSAHKIFGDDLDELSGRYDLPTIAIYTLITTGSLSDTMDTQPEVAVPKPPTKRARKALRIAALEVYSTFLLFNYNWLIVLPFRNQS